MLWRSHLYYLLLLLLLILHTTSKLITFDRRVYTARKCPNENKRQKTKKTKKKTE